MTWQENTKLAQYTKSKQDITVTKYTNLLIFYNLRSPRHLAPSTPSSASSLVLSPTLSSASSLTCTSLGGIECCTESILIYYVDFGFFGWFFQMIFSNTFLLLLFFLHTLFCSPSINIDASWTMWLLRTCSWCCTPRYLLGSFACIVNINNFFHISFRFRLCIATVRFFWTL